MWVVVVWRWAREDGVSVGWGAVELEPPQVLSVDRFVALQHFDGLVHGEPLPLTTCRGRQSTMYEFKGSFHVGSSQRNSKALTHTHTSYQFYIIIHTIHFCSLAHVNLPVYQSHFFQHITNKDKGNHEPQHFPISNSFTVITGIETCNVTQY